MPTEARPARPASRAVTIAALVLLGACGDRATLTVADGTGPTPRLPPEVHRWLPTVKVPEAVGWQTGQMPTPAAGLKVEAFATGLTHPRWLHLLPDGSVLVAESDAPAKGEGAAGGLKDWIAGLVKKRAGAGVPSPDRILRLVDADGDGRAEQRTVFLEQIRSPFGMALVGDQLYVASAEAVFRLPWKAGDRQARERPTQVVALPGGPLNHHWTKNLIADAQGQRLYITVGSNSNVAENGLALEQDRARILELRLTSGELVPYATGLRNPNGMAWVPGVDGQPPMLWTVVNERDELGSDLVPDYLTSVRPGGFYGWPWSYWGQRVDRRVEPPRPDMVQRALTPDYALGPHTASLGLHWLQPGRLHGLLGDGMVIGQHGSWNRQPPSGYRVVFVPFKDGRPQGQPVPLLTGFLDAEGDQVRGRPVGVVQDGLDALLVADDAGNAIWRISVDAGSQAVPR